ncbi:hypothetical protein DCS_03315 [Drechmeria coniospora]|uniref:Uncharacterized protein n=1 Tax=Drechmeria coniospora TaxID=98403 RepID=A0A151GGT3_DRECN|nr:hypothetical protein DCS_03315 [Drechmeria coniospora]KYK56317.1 hypothetical protein DCS_03315 [Drechmeria coniospora]
MDGGACCVALAQAKRRTDEAPGVAARSQARAARTKHTRRRGQGTGALSHLAYHRHTALTGPHDLVSDSGESLSLSDAGALALCSRGKRDDVKGARLPVPRCDGPAGGRATEQACG